MERPALKIIPLSGHVLYDDGEHVCRLPLNEEEESQFIECYIENF